MLTVAGRVRLATPPHFVRVACPPLSVYQRADSEHADAYQQKLAQDAASPRAEGATHHVVRRSAPPFSGELPSSTGDRGASAFSRLRCQRCPLLCHHPCRGARWRAACPAPGGGGGYPGSGAGFPCPAARSRRPADMARLHRGGSGRTRLLRTAVLRPHAGALIAPV